MQLKEPDRAQSQRRIRRKPDLEQIRRLRAKPAATSGLWSKPYHELTPEEISELKRQFFAGA